MTAILTDQLKTTTRTAPVASVGETAAIPALLIERVSKSFVVGRAKKPVAAITDVELKIGRASCRERVCLGV